MQIAFERALKQWPVDEQPINPVGWLCIVARNAAIDLLRKQQRANRYRDDTAPGYFLAEVSPSDTTELNDQARLLVMCCNPRLNPRPRIALALKAVGGFKLDEISRLLYMNPPAVKRMLTRARRTLSMDTDLVHFADSPIELERCESVLQALYSLFTEGYAASSGETPLRVDVALESIRLADLLLASSLYPRAGRQELQALLALMLLQMARFPARIAADGTPVRLEDQDRSLWNADMVRAGFAALSAASGAAAASSYHVEARIAAEHAIAGTFADTQWLRILELYDQLLTIKDTRGARLARCVALRYVEGPAVALEELQALTPDHQRGGRSWQFIFHSIRAEMLAAGGDRVQARLAWHAAGDQAPTAGDRQFVRSRLSALADRKSAGA